MTMKTKKTLQHIAAVAVVLLTLCLVFMMPGAAASEDNCHDASCSHVAAIGTTHYGTLAEAITAANSATSDVTIELLTDVKLTTGITINNPNKVDTTINGNKYNITPADGASFTGLIITVRTNLTINSTNISGFTTSSDIVNAYKGADLTLDNCIFKDNSCRSVVRTQSGYENTVILENTVFKNNNAAEGIVYSGSGVGTYMILNCKFESNTCSSAAAPVALPGSVSITESVFTDNEVTSTWSYAASAAYCWGSDVDIKGNTIMGNTVKATGATAAAALIVKTGENAIDLSGNTIDDTNVVQTRATSEDTFVDAADAAVFVRVSGSGTVTIDSGIIAGTVASSSQGEGILITGGTFSTDVSDYLSSDMNLVQNEDGTFGVAVVVPTIPTSSSSSSGTPTPGAYFNYPRTVSDGGLVEFGTSKVVKSVTLPAGSNGAVVLHIDSTAYWPLAVDSEFTFDISVENLGEGTSYISFKIDESKLTALELTAADVGVYHNVDGEWVKLVVTYTIEEGDVIYTAETDSFSPFKLVIEEGAAVQKEEVTPSEPVTPPTEEPTDVPQDIPGEELPDIPDVQDEPETPASPAPVLGLLAALGAAVVLRRK